MEQVLEYLIGLVQGHPVGALVLAALGSLVVIATVVIKLTPTQSDDAWLSKMMTNKWVGPLFNALEKFSLVKKK